MSNIVRGNFSESFLKQLKKDGTITHAEIVCKNKINYPKALITVVIVALIFYLLILVAAA